MTQTFKNWTEYDTWLVSDDHYNIYAITRIETDTDGSVTAEFESKEEFTQKQKELEAKREAEEKAAEAK